MAAIQTPCIKICVVDPQSGLCLGCHRTLNEIAAWTSLGDAERARIMSELPGRAADRSRQARDTAMR
jgi:uncharacterized protein